MSAEGLRAPGAEVVSLFSCGAVRERWVCACVRSSVRPRSHGEPRACCVHTSIVVKLRSVRDKEKNL